MEVISIKNMPKQAKIDLLKELGYDSDGKFVLDLTGARVKDKYFDVEVTLDRMIIMPGSVIVLDDNPMSIAAYLEEYNSL